MTDVIILGGLALVLGTVIGYLLGQKKKGVRCIGCPDGRKCSGNCSECDSRQN